MTDNTIKQLLELVKAAINENTPENLLGVDWQRLYNIAKFQSVVGLISAETEKIKDMPQLVRDEFKEAQTLNIYREAQQEVTVQKLLMDFENADIDYMPLKGFILKRMYPSPELREMCDVDILVRCDQLDAIDKVMVDNGFVFQTESAHEYIYNLGMVNIELHKSLVPNYNHDLYAYYGDGWKFAHKAEGHEHMYEMTPEDFYVYGIAHAAKHYLNGGLGIRQVADIYVMRHSMVLQYNYIDNQLKSLGLDKFDRIICGLCDMWFSDAHGDVDVYQMEAYILNSGTFGTSDMANKSRLYRASQGMTYRGAKLNSVKKAIFPAKEQIEKAYPNIGRMPYPIAIICRWAYLLTKERGRVSAKISADTVSDDEIDVFAKHCEKMGLRKTL